MAQAEVYVSTDVESDGPIPGPHSMLSIGSAAYVLEGASKKLIDTFSANLELLPGATGAKDTMEWWSKNQLAFDTTRTDLESPEAAMQRYVTWIEALPGKPVFVAYPAGFDFLFVYWYLIRFAGKSPFSFSALDVKSYAMAMMKSEFHQTTKRTMPKRWFDRLPHTHVALDDAVEQGALFCNMLAENVRPSEA